MIINQESGLVLLKFSKNVNLIDTDTIINSSKSEFINAVQQVVKNIFQKIKMPTLKNDFVIPILFLYASNKSVLFDQDLSQVYRFFINQSPQIIITKPLIINGFGPVK
jgi:hypothetical protein